MLHQVNIAVTLRDGGSKDDFKYDQCRQVSTDRELINCLVNGYNNVSVLYVYDSFSIISLFCGNKWDKIGNKYCDNHFH